MTIRFNGIDLFRCVEFFSSTVYIICRYDAIDGDDDVTVDVDDNVCIDVDRHLTIFMDSSKALALMPTAC